MQNEFSWAVIGAGPAGIAAVGQLLDHGVPAASICWIDPLFTVGDFGSKWQKVPSNTSVLLFKKFLQSCASFDYPGNFPLDELEPGSTCQLKFMAEPLQWVTEQLRAKVFSCLENVQSLELRRRRWEITTSSAQLIAKNVILAIGSEAKSLSHAHGETISLEIALDPPRLAQHCQPQDTVAVFGSSHSAILILRNLLEQCQLKNVINFYQAPLRYAVHLDNEIIFDDTGLKGSTAAWAREYIDGEHPPLLIRALSHPEPMRKHLSMCNKVIYAIGFQRRSLHIEGLGEFGYNPHSGIIAPGLFGFGIAFPEAKLDRFGTLEYRVGLWKFMDYLRRVLPFWLQYST